jgi:hypothetical protein
MAKAETLDSKPEIVDSKPETVELLFRAGIPPMAAKWYMMRRDRLTGPLKRDQVSVLVQKRLVSLELSPLFGVTDFGITMSLV